ncbi:hypothetical protein EMIHUDRAFT_219519 [Emiliania huxleyi CCMP1516]|uniref:START domain-containing protein n=2 Tax=Emiliania huxleyi TaxID=2903 RepID=A0A0D3I4I7_EMIH1|nr:hypothetical protein EMIHUDRAFT_219519 [Emiliania huxleyi CCMP1516]EOD06172.1 hypothetical protein EMIHUDRAFT_219519 [Emiliania huxleyi CCMP1516]|eukprot:XP_005758601.1 hypothetical protein EMIHUDRAFT_219519 [Emiliania huxleyi CCMP1516]
MYLDSTAHEDLLSAGFFHARTLADGEQSLRIYTRLEPDSLLGIRASGTVGATAAEVISVLREVDLIPEWNRFCDFGILLRVLRQNVLWASAGVRLPWPVPPQSLLVRAKVEADATRPGAILAVAQSVDAKSRRRLAQGVAMPSPLSSRLELPVEMAVGRLTAAGDALTRFEAAPPSAGGCGRTAPGCTNSSVAAAGSSPQQRRRIPVRPNRRGVVLAGGGFGSAALMGRRDTLEDTFCLCLWFGSRSIKTHARSAGVNYG